ncbi:hypothetical protein K432DRAFT_383532 [Lepidopterella palustris CBS 459.81]|uniref:RRM domain-containing protein n=1 Tax=Lepidopterella palustris CBS 459.81 TaxID=1314670 RepID=A0A8E2E7Z5_9PEZI|nr:hypothetical protein K432DRAFT_383532 [Lepidopterella palustris CBS 459.81]
MDESLRTGFELHIAQLDAQCHFLNEAVNGSHLAVPGFGVIVQDIRQLRTQTSKLRARMDAVKNNLIDYISGVRVDTNRENLGTALPQSAPQTHIKPSLVSPADWRQRPFSTVGSVSEAFDNLKPESMVEGNDLYADSEEAARIAMHERRRLFVGNLPLGTTEEEILAFFAPYKVESAIIPRKDPGRGQPGRYGFVNMKTSEDAQSVISLRNNKPLLNRRLVVKLAAAPPRPTAPGKRRTSDPPSRTEAISPTKKARTDKGRASPPIEYVDISEEVDARLKERDRHKERGDTWLLTPKKRKRGYFYENEDSDAPKERNDRRLTPPLGMTPLLKKQKLTAHKENGTTTHLPYENIRLGTPLETPATERRKDAELVYRNGAWIFV